MTPEEAYERAQQVNAEKVILQESMLEYDYTGVMSAITRAVEQGKTSVELETTSHLRDSRVVERLHTEGWQTTLYRNELYYSVIWEKETTEVKLTWWQRLLKSFGF
jgi:hypothetical protein